MNWENSIKIGDVVLIESPNLSRVKWSMSRVTELFSGRDGKVRSVELIKPNREYAFGHFFLRTKVSVMIYLCLMNFKFFPDYFLCAFNSA